MFNLKTAKDSTKLRFWVITVSHQACHLTRAQGVISDFFEKKFPLILRERGRPNSKPFKPNDRQTTMARASA
jgi:hypothetical protein